MKVYVICKNVDLGCHIEKIYLSSETAYKECFNLNQEYIDIKTKDLVEGCGYTQEDAFNYAARSLEYWVEEYEVES